MRKKILVVAAILLAAIVTATACTKKNNKKENKETSAQTTTNKETTEKSTEKTTEPTGSDVVQTGDDSGIIFELFFVSLIGILILLGIKYISGKGGQHE